MDQIIRISFFLYYLMLSGETFFSNFYSICLENVGKNKWAIYFQLLLFNRIDKIYIFASHVLPYYVMWSGKGLREYIYNGYRVEQIESRN